MAQGGRVIFCVSVGGGHRIWVCLIVKRHGFAIGRTDELLRWGLEQADRVLARQPGWRSVCRIFGCFGWLSITPIKGEA